MSKDDKVMGTIGLDVQFIFDHNEKYEAKFKELTDELDNF
jgi:hypothetical protein